MACLLMGLMHLYCQTSKAQTFIDDPVHGLHLVQNFTTEDYLAEAQNWSIVQGDDGLIYVGNNLGVLEYDGVAWQRIATTDNAVVRSLAKDKEGTIYVGAIGDFGRLTTDSTGNRVFESLVHLLPEEEREFNDVWRIFPQKDGVYFQALDRLIRVKNEEAHVWHPPGLVYRSYAIQDSIYLEVQGKGLLQFDGDSLHAAPGGKTFENRRLVNLFSLNPESYLAVTQREGLFQCSYSQPVEDSCMPYGQQFAEPLLAMRSYSAIRLADSSIAIGTMGSGLVILDQAGAIRYTLDESKGLVNNIVSALMRDDQNGLWITTTNGISRLGLNASLSKFDKQQGILGDATGMVRHNGVLYVTTLHGLFSLSDKKTEGVHQFEKYPKLADQCPSLLSTPQGLLVGCANGVYSLDSEDWIETTGGSAVYSIHRSTKDTSRIYIGMMDGLGWLQLQNNKWTFVERLDFNAAAYRIVEDEAGLIWVSTIKDGVFSVDFDPGSTTHTIKQYREENGLPSGIVVADNIGKEAVFLAYDGSWIVRPELAGDSVSFSHHPVFEGLPDHIEKRIRHFAEDEEGRLWLFNGDQSSLAAPQQDGSYTYQPTTLRLSGVKSVYTMLSEPTGDLWFGGPYGVIKTIKERAIPNEESYSVLLRSVTTRQDSVLFGGASGELVNEYNWPHTINSLRFKFAAPRFDAPELTQYRTILVGLEHAWSSWTHEPLRDFTNLGGGTYTMRIQARDVYGFLSEETDFTFAILPPWHQTAWAYLIWFGLGAFGIIGLVLGYNKYQSKQLQQRNNSLEALVLERTAEIVEQKRAIEGANIELTAVNDSLLSTNKILEERTTQLRDTLEQNREIIGITAHDLKNPLGGIIGLAQLVIEDINESPDAALELVQDNLPLLKEEAERMLRIVTKLLDEHREKEERIQLIKQRISLDAIIEGVMRWNYRQAEEKGIKIHFEPGSLQEVEVDILAIQRVLDNYVSNAVKYSPLYTHIRINIEQERSFTRIAVTDEGPGLTDEDMENVFGKMQRLSAKPTGDEHSTGLGLYIAKQLVELHGGQVGVDSVWGQGATFWFTIPTNELESAGTHLEVLTPHVGE